MKAVQSAKYLPTAFVAFAFKSTTNVAKHCMEDRQLYVVIAM